MDTSRKAHHCTPSKIFYELPFRKKGEIWNYYRWWYERIYQSKKTNTWRIKEALTIKDLGAENEAEVPGDYIFKSPAQMR